MVIGKLRRALGDSAEEPRYIETLARRGYRLMVPVEWMVAEVLRAWGLLEFQVVLVAACACSPTRER